MFTYQQLYGAWAERDNPSDTTRRMTRTALGKIAKALRAPDWRGLCVPQQPQALVLLDGAMAREELAPQSRCNYRHYVRKLYAFATREQIDLAAADSTFWPAAPSTTCIERRAQVAYQRFVTWAIGRGLWPATVGPADLLAWALESQRAGNKHWRRDYARLTCAWSALVAAAKLPKIDFPPLPAALNTRYRVDAEQWPVALRDEWTRMCRTASAPLRDGGMRPWREVTRNGYEQKLGAFLGWITREQPGIELTCESWATLLSPQRCQAFINWLVARSPNEYINPGHTAFLRFVRGLHRFLLSSPDEVIKGFTELCRRCEVQQRDKALRMVSYTTLQDGLRRLLDHVTRLSSGKVRTKSDPRRTAELQVDALILGLLVTRALRRRNIRELRLGVNLRASGSGYDLVYAPTEMKGHRKFETSWPTELVPVLSAYLRSGYKALTGRMPQDGDALFVTHSGAPFSVEGLTARVKSITRKWVGKALHPHIFRHILATHGAQVLKLTPPELAALLGHRSVSTVMVYYEVTDPRRAAARLDDLRRNGDGPA